MDSHTACNCELHCVTATGAHGLMFIVALRSRAYSFAHPDLLANVTFQRFFIKSAALRVRLVSIDELPILTR